MKVAEVKRARVRASAMLRRAGFPLKRTEAETMEVVDFGLGDLPHFGLQLVVYENNDRYCAKEIIMFPRQICAEHYHPPLSDTNPGKRETFRCRWGTAYLYVPGTPAKKPKAKVPDRYRPYLTVQHEIILKPGDQYTLAPGTPHWFQAGPGGAILSEFSSTSVDESDLFTDPHILRMPVVE
jgi:D-lyxose ketol-isomerase